MKRRARGATLPRAFALPPHSRPGRPIFPDRRPLIAALVIGFTLVDNAFVHADDFERAQQIADHLQPQTLNKKLDRFARQYCPAAAEFSSSYHWSF